MCPELWRDLHITPSARPRSDERGKIAHQLDVNRVTPQLSAHLHKLFIYITTATFASIIKTKPAITSLELHPYPTDVHYPIRTSASNNGAYYIHASTPKTPQTLNRL
jgi:hypothetical protein